MVIKTRRLGIGITLLASYLIYTVSWSYITVMKFFAGYANVFDLGLFMEFGWEALHTVHSLSAFLFWFAYNGIIYLISPITLLNSYPAILVLQSAFIGLAVFPLYGIAKHFLNDDLTALLISLSYLIYFPLAGVNWFDAHYMAFFPTLFITAYYLYIKGRYRLSLAFFIMSSMVRYPYFIFPFMFALVVLAEQLRDHWKSGKHVPAKLYLSISIIGFGIFLSIIYYFFYVHGSFAASFAGTSNITGTVRLNSGNITYMLSAKELTTVLFFLPLMFLPILSKRWIVFYVPFFYLVFTSNYWGYMYPYVFQLQYPAGIVPFLYLGLIEGSKVLSKGTKRKDRAISAMLIVSVIIFAFAYEPYGPLNSKSGIDYNMAQQTSANMKVYSEINSMVKLINRSDPYVLFQSNLPQVLPRPLKYLNTPLITNINEVTYNLDHIYPNGTSVPIRVDYVLSDPYSGYYYSKGGPPFNASMYDFIRQFYNSTDYGLLAEASGMMLLERNYYGSVRYFVPMNQNFTTSQMLSTLKQKNSDYFNFTDFNSTQYTIAWYGPYTTLYPGTYKLTFWLYTTNNSNPLLLQVTANGGSTVLMSKTLEPGTLKDNQWNRVNLTLYSNEIYPEVEFRGLLARWNGTLLFRGVNLKQTGPGLPNAFDQYFYADQLFPGQGARTASNGSIVVTNESNTIAWYGPYTTLGPGSYMVKYSLSTTNSSPYNRAMLQVTADGGKVMLGEQGITGSDLGSSYVMFSISSAEQNVEFRGYVQNWQGNLTLNNVEVLKSVPTMNVTYPAYGLYSNIYVNGTVQLNNKNTFWYGPYTTLEPGNYTVTFKLNGSAVLDLQATANYGSTYLATRTVSIKGQSAVTLNFNISKTEQYVEFRGYLIGGSAKLQKVNVCDILSR
ncbi:MAG: DUF2079 domain-containing protein [Nitrososphaeria archaeon]